MRRRSPRKPHSSQERWLVSYADFITLLFAFFVLLYASSQADQNKQRQVSRAIDSAFHSLGVFSPAAGNTLGSSAANDATSRSSPVVHEQTVSPARVKDDLEQIQRHFEQLLSNEIANQTVSLKMGKNGLIISLREAGFFTSGSATPQPESLPVLREIAAVLGQTPYDLRIEGHTDNLPIHNSEFDSNWELSSARSTRLARIFLNTGAIPPQRISASGYAEFHPVATNATAAGRAQNRRVDLVVMPRTTLDLSLPQGDARNANWRKITD
jgi:chemotaxis protein MotB